MEESVASAIDQIRQDSKDIRDFLKKVFSDSDFRAMKNDKDFVQYLKSIYEGVSVNEGLKHNDMYTMLDIAAGYSSTQDQAANQMWSDEQDLYDYLKSDHIPKKYHKKFHNDIKRRFKDIKESVVNEASKEAMGIAALTGTRGSAVEDFILKHELDGKKLFKSITKANLRGRLNFVSALAGKDGNPNQKLTIKLHKENFNEELSTELAFEVITFMERPVMETVMVDEFEKSDIVEMLVNEGINDVLTEGVKAEFNTLVETYNKK